MYQRRCTRYTVHFQSTLSTPQIPDSSGTAVDLSVRGCRVQSFSPVIPGLRVKLSIVVSEPDTTIEIDQAVVRWTSGQEFGVEFATIAPDQFATLTTVLQHLSNTSSRS
jgi:hypothetical protein